MSDTPLRIALLTYRGNPRSGGQGVYVRNLSRALVDAGHEVTVFSGQPYPHLDPRVSLAPVPSLNLYGEPNPFRIPSPREFRGPVDVLETLMMSTGAFPEPLTFSLRVRPMLRAVRDRFDIVHDNTTLGYGLLGLGLPALATIHHAVTIDRRIQLASDVSWRERLFFRRWFSFARMQARVARRMARVLTVSEAAKDDIVRDLGVRPDRVHVVPNGVNPDLFRPREDVETVPGRIVSTASADVPVKGLSFLLEAVAKVRTERDAHLVVVGKPREDGPTQADVRRLGLDDAVTFRSGLEEDEVARLLATAEIAVVPSIYEGFSLPAVEAMATGLPLVATTGGALPEVAGNDGDTALLVPPGDADALAVALRRLLDDPDLRTSIAERGRARVLERFTWSRAAHGTVNHYREVLGC